MTENIELIEMRAKLKQQLTAGVYKTIIEVIFDGTGRFIQKLTRQSKPSPAWTSALIIGLATLALGLLISLLLGEFSTLRREFIPLEISGVVIALTGWIGVRTYTRIINTTLEEHLLEAIESATDLTDLQRWLISLSNLKHPLIFGVVYVILLVPYGLGYLAVVRGGFVGYGALSMSIISFFFGGILVYFIFIFITLPVRLSRYHYKLYPADPSSSEVVDRISNLLTVLVYMVAAMAALSTFLFALFGFGALRSAVGIIPMIVVGWGPLTIIFLLNQYALSKIITEGKWIKLNEIQAQVAAIETVQNVADKDTMEAINRLMDYHDRIKGTRNSALNLRASLNFLNSLLLPLITFILANLDQILAFFTS